MLTTELAERIETGLVRAAEARALHLAEIPGNPLGVEHRAWGRVSATLVRRDVFYYSYFNAIRGVGRGTESDLDPALSWFRANHRACSVSISPFDADTRLLDSLVAHGLRPARFMTVLYGFPRVEPPVNDTVTVRSYRAPDLDVFLSVWVASQPPTEWDFLKSIGAAEFADWRCYVAFVQGQPAAIAGLHIRDGVGVMASGHTVPDFRGQGCQTALIRQRIADAANAGCDLILSQATPGTVSQRNLERAGLRTAYTQTIWTDAR